MRLNKLIILGATFGFMAPVAAVTIAAITRHSFESVAMLFLLPGFIPFASADPEHQLSAIELGAAFTFNIFIFALLGYLFGLLRSRIGERAP